MNIEMIYRYENLFFGIVFVVIDLFDSLYSGKEMA